MKCECGEYFNMQNIEEVKRHWHKSSEVKSIETQSITAPPNKPKKD